jgi:hypothetical protein
MAPMAPPLDTPLTTRAKVHLFMDEGSSPLVLTHKGYNFVLVSLMKYDELESRVYSYSGSERKREALL